MQFEHKKDYELATTLVFTRTTENIIYTMKIIAQVNRTCNPNSSGTIIDRKLIGTSEKHNWSSRPPTNMNHNFLKIL